MGADNTFGETNFNPTPMDNIEARRREADRKKLHTWQACPVCWGTGETNYTRFVNGLLNTGPFKCHVCNGTGLISMLDGQPPNRNRAIIGNKKT